MLQNAYYIRYFFTSITRSFRTPCYLCLHVKKRFPKRKIKAWIVQTLLACSKLLTPTYTNKNQFHIDPWFILKSIWYSCISTIVVKLGFMHCLFWNYYSTFSFDLFLFYGTQSLNEIRLWEIRKQETLIPSGQKKNCGCTINFMFSDDFQEKVYHHVFGNIVNITHTNMLCFVLLSSVKCKIYHTSLVKLHSILGICFMPYICCVCTSVCNTSAK